jgi:hypothetical protein
MLLYGGVLAAMLLAGIATAYPTLYGPTGGVALPTADVAKGFVGAADYYHTDIEQSYPLRGEFGLGRGVEVGGLYTFNNATNVWGANAKLGFSLLGMNDFAVGGNYTRETDGDLKTTQAYLVHTHRMTLGNNLGLRVSVGGNWTKIKDAVIDADGIRGYAVGDLALTRALSVIGEYQTTTNDLPEAKHLSSWGVRLNMSPSLSFQGGWTNASLLNGFGTGAHNWYAGLSFAFGGVTAEPAPKTASATPNAGYGYERY